jgi:hypothetical protein
MSRRTARGNRYGLVLTGLIVAIAGGLALARGFGAFADIDFFGTAAAHDPLLSATESDYTATHVWVWYVLAVIAVLVALWALRWLIVQMRSDRVRVLRIEPDRGRGSTNMRADALADALADEIDSYRGVDRAEVRVIGDPDRPRLHLVVGAERGSDLTTLRERIRTQALAHARQVLECDELPTLVTLRLDTADRSRTQ